LGTEIAERATLPTPAEWDMATKLAESFIATAFVPEPLRKQGPGAVLACILAGKELGLGPMTSLREIDVIQGTPAPSGQLLAALARRHGHKIEVLEYTETRVTVRGTRADDGSTLDVTWTIGMAAKIGLASKQVWKHYPRMMLLWRCITELNRVMFSGESLGLGKYTAEEIGGDDLPGDADEVVTSACIPAGYDPPGDPADVPDFESSAPSAEPPAGNGDEPEEAPHAAGSSSLPTVSATDPVYAVDPDGTGVTFDVSGGVTTVPAGDNDDPDLPDHVRVLVASLDAAVSSGMTDWTVETVLELSERKWGISTLGDLTEEHVTAILDGLAKKQAERAAA
jgi:hypothetical protein